MTGKNCHSSTICRALMPVMLGPSWMGLKGMLIPAVVWVCVLVCAPRSLRTSMWSAA